MRKHNLSTVIACILLAIWTVSCTTTEMGSNQTLDREGTAKPLSTSDPTSPKSIDSPMPTIPLADPVTSLPTATTQPTEAIIELIRWDLAQRLNANASEIEITHLESRIWSDAGLGCVARKGLFNEQSISGYRILLSHMGFTYEYHTSLTGTFRYCLDAGKPLDPIK
jgi:hypothetical protein